MTRRRGSRRPQNLPSPPPAGGVDQLPLVEPPAPTTDPALDRGRPLRILWIGTKSPLPPLDGGRLVVLETLRALAAAGHQVVFIAPVEGTAEERAAVAEELRPLCEPVLTKPRRRPALDDALRSLVERQPVTIRRHFRAKVQAAVAGRLSTGSFDVVHCEQVHAVLQAAPALDLGVPVVLRQQNVETDLWSMMARHNPVLRPLVALEAARVRRYEAQVLRRVALTVALTGRDAERLRSIGGAAVEVATVRAPFPAELPAGPPSFGGRPAVVLFGDQRWQPNRLQIEEFARALWPRVHAALPEARLHVLGGDVRRLPAGVTAYAAPSDSREAFAAGSVLAVPLRIASGVRMKVLEAWARGVPVVATPVAAGGLDAEDGRELLLAEDAEGFARAFARLVAEPALREWLIANGRAALRSRHAPPAVAAELAAAYRMAIARRA
jgi:glycosyltransferase involved in cell wall biosynthesis